MNIVRCRIKRLTSFSALCTIRNIGGSALLLLAVTLVLGSCLDGTPDINGTDTGEYNHTPIGTSDAIAPAAISDISANAIVGSADVNLRWVGSASDNAAMVRISWMPTTDRGPMLIPHQDGVQNLTISALVPEIEYVFSIVVIDNANTESEEVTVTQRTLQDTTAPDSVRRATAIPLGDDTKMLVRWADSISADVSTITISWSSTATGTIDGSTTAEVGAEQIIISNLTAATPYTFVITVADVAGNSTVAPVRMVSSAAVDADGDGLIDITSIERLYNIRYNRAGRSYKTSTTDSGIRCGDNATTLCRGYELVRDLDFANSGSYENGEVNPHWRPNTMADSSGTMLPQADADTARNIGWEPIGSCDIDDGGCGLFYRIGDAPFATRFEGNGYTISNLYARNTDDNAAAPIALFGMISSATIHNIGLVNAAVYGSSAARDYIGGLVGYSRYGHINTSYVRGSTADGGGGNLDSVGGLVGYNYGTITASYTHNSTVRGGDGDGDYTGGLAGFNYDAIAGSYSYNGTVSGGDGDNDIVGGLVGRNFVASVTASYATGTVDGGMGNDTVGGLVGHNSTWAVIFASYATAAVNGGAGDQDIVGGLVGENANSQTGGFIAASYATGDVDGGTGTDDSVGSLASGIGIDPVPTGGVTASYGFGTVINANILANNGTTPPQGITGSGIAAARQLTAPGTATTTAVDATWSDATENTLNAWHFGNTIQAPALQYADYDGAGTLFGCGNTIGSVATIPSVVPDGAGGTMSVDCGTTLLSGQQ